MELSVIIPNLNSPVINRTIEALKRQQYDLQQVEIIIVGLDEPGLVKTGERVIFDNSTTPLSPAGARNRGAAQARGAIIAFTDADCIPRPDWLHRIIRNFDDPAVNVVGGGVEFDTHRYWALADNLSMFYEYLSIHAPGERCQLPSLNLALRSRVFTELGGFDERYPRPAGEDADLTIRLRKKGYRLVFDPQAVVYHAPPRHSFSDLLRHSYYQGMYSTKVDPRYAGEEGLPGPLRSRLGVILAAPFLAALVSAGVFIKYPRLLRYWHTLPGIYISKIAWCLGAAHHPSI